MARAKSRFESRCCRKERGGVSTKRSKMDYQRAHDDVHRLGQQGVGEGAEFPVARDARWRTGLPCPAASLFVVFEALVADPVVDVAPSICGNRAKATRMRPMEAKTPSMVRCRQAASCSG